MSAPSVLDERAIAGRALAGDPLTSTLGRTPVAPVIAGVGWLVLTVGGDLVLTLSRGRFFSTPGYTGWWFDLTTVLQEVVVFPLLAFFYLWTPVHLLRALEALRAEGVLEIRPDDETWLARAFSGAWLGARRPARWLPVAVLVIAIGTALTLWWAYGSTLSTQLWLADPGIAPIKAIFWTVNTYMGAWLVLRAAIFVKFLGRLFSSGRTIHIEPLHPDGCGGLAPLARFSLRLAVFIGFVGASFVLVERNYLFGRGLQLTWQALPVHAIAVCCLVASVVAFFAPLAAPHDAMARAKRGRLAHLSDQFASVDRAIDGPDFETLIAAAPKWQIVRAIYAEVAKFPVWPFEIRILRAFAVAVVGQPALAVFVDIFKGELKDLAKVVLGG
jgi:hypothetical protein